MSAVKEVLLSSGLLLAIAATSTNAAVVLSQNFDNTAIFDPTITTMRTVGDLNTVGGEWGVFDSAVESTPALGDFNESGGVDAADYVRWRKNDTANAPLPNDDGLATQAGRYDLWATNFAATTGVGHDFGPWVVNDGSHGSAAHIGPVHSGTQSFGFETPENYDSLQIFGRVNNGVPANENYEVSFYLRQDDLRSSSMLTVGGDYVGADPQPIDMRVFFEGGTQNIFLLYRAPGYAQGQGFWIDTGIDLVEDTWMKMRVVADVTGANEYNIFVTPEGESEIAGGQPVPLHMEGDRQEIWQLDISRQGDAHKITYFDDFEMSSSGAGSALGTARSVVPEPSTAGLLLLASALGAANLRHMRAVRRR